MGVPTTFAVFINNSANEQREKLIPIRVLSDKFEWQVTHEHAAKCYQLERILVSEATPTDASDGEWSD